MKRFGIRNKIGHTAGEIAVWYIVLLFEGGLTIEVVNKVEKLNTELPSVIAHQLVFWTLCNWNSYLNIKQNV